MIADVATHLTLDYHQGLDSLTIIPFQNGNLKSMTFSIKEIDSIIFFEFESNKSILNKIREISNFMQGEYANFTFTQSNLIYSQRYDLSSHAEDIAYSFEKFYTLIMNLVSTPGNIIVEYDNKSFIFTEKRAVYSFSILKDLAWHTRTAFEGIREDGTRVYGDPSRTITVLEECGFKIQRDTTIESNQRMQKYKLEDLSQDIENIKRRTNITTKMKKALYERDEYKCAICHGIFDQSQLEPDHKTPIQIQDDDINVADPDWMNKLQTICKICNGRKREVCKKCEHFDCPTCAWAYPEKLTKSIVRISSDKYESVLKICEESGESINEYIESLIEKEIK